jgi:hypothetical protein
VQQRLRSVQPCQYHSWLSQVSSALLGLMEPDHNGSTPANAMPLTRAISFNPNEVGFSRRQHR